MYYALYLKCAMASFFCIWFDSSSPKQYILLSETAAPILKCKGVKRSLVKKQGVVDVHTFIDVTKRKKLSKQVLQYTLKRKNGQIFLTSQRKRLLSKFTAKRFFCDKYSSDAHYFGWPLHLGPFLKWISVLSIHCSFFLGFFSQWKQVGGNMDSYEVTQNQHEDKSLFYSQPKVMTILNEFFLTMYNAHVTYTPHICYRTEKDWESPWTVLRRSCLKPRIHPLVSTGWTRKKLGKIGEAKVE